MTPDNALYLANYVPRRPRSETDMLRCTHCKEWSELREWHIGYVDCETCGCNEAMGCPRCGECNTEPHFYDEPIQVKP